jgi:cellulose synthase/poly-beta-1,6-N-acetylglucosamine synthase-like glycosyltransferase
MNPMATTLFVILIGLIWLRLFAITILAVGDGMKACHAVRLNNNVTQPLTDVTVLVPAYQEQDALAATLASVRPAIAAGATLIVVDDGSTDATAAIARAVFAALGSGELIAHSANRGKPAALNSGLAAVATPLVLTLDADTVVIGDSVQAARAQLGSAPQDVVAVAFDVGVAPSRHWLNEIQGLEYDGSLNFERRGQSVLRAVSVCPGAASLWRVNDLREVGGFSAETVTEDVDVTLALAARGKRCLHCAEARADTLAPRTFGPLLAQRRRWSLGHYQNIGRHARALGKDATFTTLTYPNFFLLSAFLPLFCVLSVTTLFAERGAWQYAILVMTGAWLLTTYAQRWLALRMARRTFSIGVFLIEPFATQFFHLCALALVIAAAGRRIIGLRTDMWLGT